MHKYKDCSRGMLKMLVYFLQIKSWQIQQSEYFGKLTEDDSTYKNESKASTAFLDGNYIICTAQTQDEPVVDVYIAPTQLDPKYQTTEAGTGFSTHNYDGLTDPNTPSQSLQVS